MLCRRQRFYFTGADTVMGLSALFPPPARDGKAMKAGVWDKIPGPCTA